MATRRDQVLVTNGAQHAIALCATLCLQRGDSALVEDPTYFGAIDAFRTVGARLSSLPVTSTPWAASTCDTTARRRA